jgi:cation:H+ antiporter
MILSIVLFIIGIFLLIKGADLLVNGASSLAKRFNVSDLVIGLTVVAFGTSTPELFVNLISAIKGNTDLAIGNILGSNISNIFLILGVTALIYPMHVGKGTVWREIPLSLLAVILLGFIANDQLIDGAQSSAITRIDGLVLLSFFIIFIYYSISIAKPIEGMEEQIPEKPQPVLLSLLFVILGLGGLTLGGHWVVQSAIVFAKALGMSERLIGLTIVAIGTSLPELVTSVVAAMKRKVEIAVGNVVGSNIFNVFFVLAITSTIRPLPFNLAANPDIAVAIVSNFLLFFFMFMGKKNRLDRWEGGVFVLLYIGYLSYLIL